LVAANYALLTSYSITILTLNGPPGMGLGVRLTTPPGKKKYCYETSIGGQGPPRAVEPMMMMINTI
jgi:hypothetical protein